MTAVSPTLATAAADMTRARSRAGWVNWAVLAVFVAWTAGVGAFHEPWVDEAQSWLIGRDASPWDILSRYARYEGSPALWHLLLWGLNHVGYPYRGLWLVSAAGASAGAAIILLRAPFPAWMRFSVVFSYFPAYQYAVVARSYALDAVLIPALAVFHAKRMDRPLAYGLLLGLLANCNTHSFLLAAVIGAEFALTALRSGAWRRPAVQGGLLAAAALGALAAWTAWPPGDVSFKAQGSTLNAFLRALVLAAEPFVDRLDVFGLDAPDLMSQLGAVVLTPLLVAPSVVLFARGRAATLFLAGAGALVAFTAIKYGQPWHMGLIFFLWVFALWISWDRLPEVAPKDRRIVLATVAAILAVQVWDAAAAGARELGQVYAPGRALAADLQTARARKPGLTIGASGFKAFVVQPWVDRNIFSNYVGPTPGVAFYDWRRSQPYARDPDLAAWRSLLARRYDIVLLSSLEMIEPKDLPAYRAVAHELGYCGTIYDGGMIWKTYLPETQAIVLYKPCPAAPALRPRLEDAGPLDARPRSD